jgi:ribosomal protein S18 acetylase RimI-like enzyme
LTRSIWLHDRAAIFAALSPAPALQLYALGDLDDFFFPHTIWRALEAFGAIRQIALIYTGAAPPVLHAITPEGGVAEMRELVRSMLPLLPRSFYSHVTPGVEDALAEAYDLAPHGLHRKMVLADPARLEAADASGTVALGPGDRAEIEALYAAAYPGNWFDARMLETGRYVGVREGGALASIAGVHVFSKAYRVAALGNITTHPAHRRKGFASRAVAALCRELRPDCDVIGLNVHAQNRAAISLYERLGFEIAGSYEEIAAELRISARAPA